MKIFIVIVFALSISACSSSCLRSDDKAVPQFNPDQAHQRIIDYERFGPKVPGSASHLNAGNWIVETLKKMGLETHEQKGEFKNSEIPSTPIRNIIARLNPEKKKRILLSAHWDNRPFADQDESQKTKPVPGVNDGGSGVVVLMGIAQALIDSKQTSNLDHGVDFFFWDAEDGGTPSLRDSYCLGSQFWAQNRYPENYQAEFGINFDMVGRTGAVFPIERFSNQQAGDWVRKIRAAATKIGYGEFFPDYFVGPVIDDHYYISRGTGIPVVDIIHLSQDGKFPPEWHTRNDNSSFISRDVLKVVGQTTLQLIFDLEN